jgi:hypothetical protein
MYLSALLRMYLWWSWRSPPLDAAKLSFRCRNNVHGEEWFRVRNPQRLRTRGVSATAQDVLGLGAFFRQSSALAAIASASIAMRYTEQMSASGLKRAVS